MRENNSKLILPKISKSSSRIDLSSTQNLNNQLVGQVLFPQSTTVKKDSSVMKKNSSKKDLSNEYQLKLCILLNNNDANYKEKRYNLNNLIIKYGDDYRMRLTRSEHFNNHSSTHEKAPLLLIHNKDKLRATVESDLNEEPGQYRKKAAVIESNDIRKCVPEFNSPHFTGKDLHQEGWFEKYAVSGDTAMMSPNEANEEKEIYDKIKRKEELSLKRKEESNQRPLLERKVSYFDGLNKLIETTELIRQVKAKKTKMTQIELFHYDKKQWNERLIAQLKLKEVEEKINQKKAAKELGRLKEFGLQKESKSLEKKQGTGLENDQPTVKAKKSIETPALKDKNVILGKIIQCSQDLGKIAKLCREYSLMQSDDHKSLRRLSFKYKKRKRTISM